MAELCNITGKIMYKVRRDAVAERRALASGSPGRRNVFRCGYCDHYHVGRPGQGRKGRQR